MKKTIVFTLILTLLFIPGCIFANEDNNKNNTVEFETNEYELYINYLKDQKEYKDLSREDLEKIAIERFREELKKQSKSIDNDSSEKLLKNDFTEKSIENELSDRSVKSLASSASVFVVINTDNVEKSRDNRSVDVTVSWHWNKRPIINATDTVGIAWNKDFMMEPNTVDGEYYFSENYNLHGITEDLKENYSVGSGTYVNIPMQDKPYCGWAKGGEFSFNIHNTHGENSVQLKAVYGHAVMGVKNPSISITGGPDISLDFRQQCADYSINTIYFIFTYLR